MENEKQTLQDEKKARLIEMFNTLLDSYEEDIESGIEDEIYEADDNVETRKFIEDARTAIKEFEEYRPAIYILFEGNSYQGAHVSECVSIEVYDTEKTKEENGYTSEEWAKLLTEGEEKRELRTTY